jgi:hypothetical protein
MLPVSAKKIPILEMAQCPNCSHAIDQMGNRTHCQKCGKKLTVLCINCQTNNSILFQNCMQCGSDFRVLGVEHFSKQVAKLEFDLAEFDRLDLLYKKATYLEKLWRFFVPITLFVLGIPMWYISTNIWGLLLPIDLAFIGYLLTRVYWQNWAAKIIGIPLEFLSKWEAITSAARKQLVKKIDLEKQLDYYQNELTRFRHKL